MKIMYGLMTAAASIVLAGETVARELAVGTQCTNPPYNFRTAEGEIRGFDIDLAREIGNRIGAEISIVCLRFESLIPSLLNEQFDLIMASLSITEERAEVIDFSVPYRSATGRFVGREDLDVTPYEQGEANPEALTNLQIGVQRATTHDRLLEAWYPDVSINRYDSVETMLLDLRAGRMDLIVTSPIRIAQGFLDEPQGEGFAFHGDEIVAPEFLGEGVAVGLRKNNEDLLTEINEAMVAIFEDGTFQEINLRYWDFSVMPQIWQ